jgi:hypothetical protein
MSDLQQLRIFTLQSYVSCRTSFFLYLESRIANRKQQRSNAQVQSLYELDVLPRGSKPLTTAEYSRATKSETEPLGRLPPFAEAPPVGQCMERLPFSGARNALPVYNPGLLLS